MRVGWTGSDGFAHSGGSELGLGIDGHVGGCTALDPGVCFIWTTWRWATLLIFVSDDDIDDNLSYEPV
jgi:hypothetical protein